MCCVLRPWRVWRSQGTGGACHPCNRLYAFCFKESCHILYVNYVNKLFYITRARSPVYQSHVLNAVLGFPRAGAGLAPLGAAEGGRPLSPLAAAGGVAAAGRGGWQCSAAMLLGRCRLLFRAGAARPARACYGEAAAVGSRPDAGSPLYQVGWAGRARLLPAGGPRALGAGLSAQALLLGVPE